MTDIIKISKPALEELEKLMGFKHTEAHNIICEILKLLDAMREESPS